MRIIAGSLRHRKIEMTNLESTRETQDKIRGAIFNMLGQYFSNGVALDLFAGSGAMALEAISRGIDYAYANDINKKATEVIINNASALNVIDKIIVSNFDYKAALKSYSGLKFDLIFLDPPYSLTDVSEILNEIKKYNILKDNGTIVFEMGKETECDYNALGLSIKKEKTYGIKKVVLLEVQKNENNGVRNL